MDRISSLPNEIICHIGAFLSSKEAAFATVLSKRFQNLFTIVPNLEFDDSDKNQESLMDFLDGVLALPITTRIRKFSLKCHKYFNEKLETGLAIDAHINRCLCGVLKRGVLDLTLDLYVEEGYSVPFQVFTCNTIVELKISCSSIIEGSVMCYFVIDVIPENAFLPALETLFLNSIRFSDLRGCAFQKLLSACPVLKTLTIDEMQFNYWKWSRIVSSSTLQRLTIQRRDYDNYHGIDFQSITFDTPSLTYLEYDDFVPDEYPVVNLDSLVEAKLHLILCVDHACFAIYLYKEDRISSNPTNLIKGLKNVEILHLSSD